MEKTITKEDVKKRKKEAIRKEHFVFRTLIILGAVSYKVTYDKFHGFRKTYKVRAWHPLTWIFLVFIIIFSIPRIIFDALKEIKDAFKEQTYYC